MDKKFLEPGDLAPLFELYRQSLPKDAPYVLAFGLDEELKICQVSPNLQLFRMDHRSRSFAFWLLNYKEKLEKEQIKKGLKIIDSLEGISILDQGFDSIYFKHVRYVLLSLLQNDRFLLDFNRLSHPLASEFVCDLICATMNIEKGSKVDTHLIKAAMLCSLFTPLRQSVGSCFATAPAILVQKEQIFRLFYDLFDLVTMGKIKRTISGVEYKVPFTITANQTLLKAWEFTIASFTDYEINAFKWNMMAALGFDHEKEGGIGEVIYRHLEEKLRSSNESLFNMQQEYERARSQLAAIQSLMATSDPERLRRLKIEGESALYHLRSCEEMMEDAGEDSKNYSEFFKFILEQYELQFQFYFQELYDPDLFEISGGIFEDRPAGFRLVYKHGRSEPRVWELIKDEKQYIKSLRDFFISIEMALVNNCTWEKGKGEISLITQVVLEHLESEKFLKSSFERVLVFGKKNPWSYISGGTLQSLVSCYFECKNKLIEEEILPEGPMDLVIKIVDLLKELPNPKEGQHLLLIQSPTHAFLIDPSLSMLKKAASDSGFTYTWIRDEVIYPAQNFYRSQFLNAEQCEYLLHRVLLSLSIPISLALDSFLLDDRHFSLKEAEERILGALRQLNLPNGLLLDAIHAQMAQALPFVDPKKYLPSIEGLILPKFMPFPQFLELLKWSFFKGKKWSDVAQKVEKFLKVQGIVPPPFFYFADTNWAIYYFALVVNPVSLEPELWRSALDQSDAMMMREWSVLFNDPQKKWKILREKSQYGDNHFGTYTPIDKLSIQHQKA
jgi:hypothetical protein